MRIADLQLRNYRNYSSLNLELDPNLNLLIGANAQGKTNLLESITFLSTGKSFRTRNEGEMVLWDEKQCAVAGKIVSRPGTEKLKVVYDAQSKLKEYSANGVTMPRSAFTGKLICVLFTPEDLSLVKGAPHVRRKYFDEEISKISPLYEHETGRYQHIVRQRNTLLKIHRERILHSEELAGWNEQLADKAAKIIQRRMNAIHKISLLARLAQRNLTGRDESLEITYLTTDRIRQASTPEDIRQAILDELENKKKEEARLGQTLVGPHRDDMVFTINGMNARLYASQGQQRTLVLALKLAELEFIKGETGDFPVLLFDDVFSELDEKRRKLLVETIDGRVQTFITGTEAEKTGNLKHSGRTFTITRGEVV
ncbi:MAG: DNA replication/repair protein RecF [Bacillota bacterium]|nr:DNA replication/repair protein RecF [Bacillota bacterium]MDW7684298.1 DNA replication/repair protein RecF [Bacillota bacterium]